MNNLKQILKKFNWIQAAQILLVIAIGFAPLLFAHAQFQKANCAGTGLNCGTTTDVNGLIKLVINWLLGIALAVAVLFLIIGGFQYITSAGNEESAEKGKATAINALIGIVIIILSYVIVNVVANLVSNVGGNTGTGNGGF